MIDYGKILKRAWHILWNYKILWIFGILLALTAGGGGGGGNGFNYRFSGHPGENGGYGPGTYPRWPFLREFGAWAEKNILPLFVHPEQHVATLIWIGAAILLLIIVTGVIFAILRYVSEAAVIRMVDGYEQTGAKVGFKQGWKLGWSRRAFRMWVIGLVISLPAILFIALLIGLGVLFFKSSEGGNTSLAVGGMITAIGCTFLFMFAFIILMAFLGLLRQFFMRVAALENAPVGESFRRGWQMFKSNWKSAALMWLIMLGIGIGYAIAGFILLIILIPVFILTGLAGLIVAAIPGLIAFGIANIFTSGPLTWVIGGLAALPLFFMVLFSPLTLISGWMQIFQSSVWTLTYREFKALGANLPEEIPAAASQ